MAKETLETTNKLIIPNVWKDTKSQEIFKSLEAIPDEELMKAWKEIEEAERREEEEKKKKLDVVQELIDYREAWKEKIRNLEDDDKERIIKAAENIPVKVEKDSDGSRLIEFKLWDKTYKILDPKLKTHTDDEYRCKKWNGSDEFNQMVEWRWMRGYIDQWKNQKLKEYVHEEMKKWLHVPGRWDVYLILKELGKLADVSYKSDQIAMFMYLTGIDWEYYLKPWDNELMCFYESRYICPHENSYNSYSKLFMISDSEEEAFK